MDTQLEFAKEALKRCDEAGTRIALEECIKRIERQHEELRRVAEFANCMARPVQYDDDTIYLQHLKEASKISRQEINRLKSLLSKKGVPIGSCDYCWMEENCEHNGKCPKEEEMIHSKSCLNQLNKTGKCCCGSDAPQHIPEHIPADEVPIYRFMVEEGRKDSMSFYLRIKQMLNEISQIKSPLWKEDVGKIKLDCKL